MDIFLHWLYHQQLLSGSDLKKWELIIETPAVELSDEKILALTLKAYAFGDRFLSPSFRGVVNSMIGELVYSLCFDPSDVAETIGWAFANIPSDRPVLQLLVNQFCNDWTDNNDSDDDDDDAVDALSVCNIVALRQMSVLFMVRAFLRLRELKDPSAALCHQNGCYLEHATDDKKKSCGKYHVQYNKKHDYGYLVKESSD